MTGTRSFRQARLLALLTPAALLGGAYISQYGFGLFPCEMCMWQRWPHYAAIVLAIVAFIVPEKIGRIAIGLAIAGHRFVEEESVEPSRGAAIFVVPRAIEGVALAPPHAAPP